MPADSLNRERVFELLTDLESEQIERTISVSDTNKFAQAVCAFSNDLRNKGQNGYLLIGVHDSGTLSGLKATDQFLQTLGGLRSDGNILPQPIMSVNVFAFDEGDVIVIEVQPSPFPPVRYKGITWIRVGPRKAVANEMEERILTERRSTNVSMFDMRPCIDAAIRDLELDLFLSKYLPRAIDAEFLANDKRDAKEQLAALRLYNSRFDCPTNAGILLFSKNPEYFMPGAYIQYVRFKGKTMAGDILNEKKFSGHLFGLLPRIDAFIDDAIIAQRPVQISTLQEKTIKNFPNRAIRELMMNAIMHRDYESNAPVKFYQYDDRIEIRNAGGLYGKARPENFPYENDYRNPTLAEAMKVLGYVNRFNRGISRVQEELSENGNPPAEFAYHDPAAFAVTVSDALYTEDQVETTKETTGETATREEMTGETSKEMTREAGKESAVVSDNEIAKAREEMTRETGKETTREIETTKETTREIIIRLIQEDDSITAGTLAIKTGVTEDGVWYHLKKMTKEGILKHTGPTKSGKWVILKKQQ